MKSKLSLLLIIFMLSGCLTIEESVRTVTKFSAVRQNTSLKEIMEILVINGWYIEKEYKDVLVTTELRMRHSVYYYNVRIIVNRIDDNIYISAEVKGNDEFHNHNHDKNSEEIYNDIFSGIRKSLKKRGYILSAKKQFRYFRIIEPFEQQIR